MTKLKIQIKNALTGSILFEYENENNTIKDTIIKALELGKRLSEANLCYACLSEANLCCTDLSGTYLCYADLCGANIRDADLFGANLRGARLRGANLRGARLRCANLKDADLRGADLKDADLSGANLNDADLRGADLKDAYLCGANLNDADLRGVTDAPYIPLYCPSDGAFIGWKKVHNTLVKLLIPEDARRCSATTNKCRCDKAQVLDIVSLYNGKHIKEVLNVAYIPTLLYKVGEMVYPDSFDDDRWNECSHGIHFFINKQDAINY